LSEDVKMRKLSYFGHTRNHGSPEEIIRWELLGRRRGERLGEEVVDEERYNVDQTVTDTALDTTPATGDTGHRESITWNP